MVRDPQFGATVMFGVGGDARRGGRRRRVPSGAARRGDRRGDDRLARVADVCSGSCAAKRAVSRDAARRVCSSGSGGLAIERPDVVSVDVNPLIVDATGIPIAVDALVEIGQRARLHRADQRARRARATRRSRRCSSRAASWSRGRRRIRASSGSCRSTTCWQPGYAGAVFGTNLAGEEVLGVRTIPDVDAISPTTRVDLAFVCTPAAANRRHPPRVREEGHPGRVPHHRRLRRRPASGARRRRTNWSPSPTSWAC